MTQLIMIFHNPQTAHAALTKSVWPFVKAHTTAGTKLQLSIKPKEDERSSMQNAFYWGVLLKEISEQAQINGQKYTVDAWHELGKRQHLPRRITKTTVAGRKRKVVTVTIGTTTKLSVKAMSVYLTKFSAFAATELGVVFSVDRWKNLETGRIDLETGEIFY